MTHFSKYLLAPAALIFLIPNVSLAATPTQAQQLSLELNQIQTILNTQSASTTSVSLTPGQSIQQAPSTPTGGLLTLTLQHFLHTTPNPMIPSNIPQPISQFAGISLEYDPCVAASPSVCVSEASSSYPVMTSELVQGQTTGYLHYFITLTALSTTTATFTITDSSFISLIQSQINAIATQIRALLGT